MKTYTALSWKEIKVQKMTSLLILIAVVLSTMMTTVIGQSIGILSALQEQQAGALNGYRYATFHNLTEQQRETLAEDDRFSWTGSSIALGTADLNSSGFSLQLKEYDENSLSAYPTISQLQEGRLPQNVGEIALPEDVLKWLDFTGQIGDTVTLELSISLLHDTEQGYGYSADFTLCGILKNDYVGYVSGTAFGIVGKGNAARLLPAKYLLYSTDFITKEKKGFQQTVNALTDELDIDKDYIQYNWIYLNALGIPFDDAEDNTDNGAGFSFMTVAGVLIGALVLLASGLVIYNILKIAVAKRIKEYGTLRAIGAESGQLYKLVALQIMFLCGVGIPLGAVAGVLSAKGITIAATGFFSPNIFMANSAEELAALISENGTGQILPLIISAAITLLFAFIAAIPSARYAARVTPTIAMSGVMVKVKRRNRKNRRIRHFEAFYAGLNMRRNTGRTAITILSLVMSITVFVALQGFSGILDTSLEVQKMHLADYSITNDTVGFTPAAIHDLKKQSEVDYIYTLKYILYMQDEHGTLPIGTDFSLQPSETLHIAGVDEQRLRELAPSLTDEEIQELINGRACLIKNPIQMSYGEETFAATSFSPGDMIKVINTQLKVIENCNTVVLENSGFVNGVQVVVYDTVYDKLTGNTAYSELYPVLKDGADREAFEQKIQETCGHTSGSRWLSYENTDRQLEESFGQIKLLAWGLILFIGLIGILNIINTTYTNIHTRIREIGVQRAIGMSVASLYKTFLYEGIYYGIIAAILGAVTGYICTMFVEAAITEQIVIVAVPFTPILQAAGISIFACIIATVVPLRKISDISIVESIETVE